MTTLANPMRLETPAPHARIAPFGGDSWPPVRSVVPVCHPLGDGHQLGEKKTRNASASVKGCRGMCRINRTIRLSSLGASRRVTRFVEGVDRHEHERIWGIGSSHWGDDERSSSHRKSSHCVGRIMNTSSR